MDIPQPRTFCISLRRATERWERERKHLDSIGMKYERFLGIDADVSGLVTTHTFEHDNPGAGYIIGKKSVCLCLSHYMLWGALTLCEGDAFRILEDDSKWEPNWKERYGAAMRVMPEDWDMIFLGSCCAEDKPKAKVNGEVWEVKYPMCMHSYMVRKKALPKLLECMEKVDGPLDISLFRVMDILRVYTILPRLSDQFNTLIPP